MLSKVINTNHAKKAHPYNNEMSLVKHSPYFNNIYNEAIKDPPPAVETPLM